MPDDPQRRASDPNFVPAPPPLVSPKVVNRTAAAAVLLGSIGFLYQLSVILARATSWAHFREPAGAGEVIFAIVCGLVAVAGALGLDVQGLIKSFKKE